jgi:5'-nucleotidase
MKRILVDMDGVLANWGARYDAGLDRHGEAARLIPRTAEQRTFDLMADRSSIERGIINQVMAEPGFYAELEPMPGAIDALVQMAEEFEVFICTSPWAANPTCVQDKLDWVGRYLGNDWRSRVIVTNDKTTVHADILIDDRPDIPNLERASWQQVFFDQPYNQNEPDAEPSLRINHWGSWKVAVYYALERCGRETPATSGEVRKVSSTGGEKGAKPQRYDLLPVLPLDMLAELYGNGAAKYAAHNWRRGYDWSLSYAAAMRHLTRFWNGEDIDPEMGLPHVTCATFHLFALAQFMADFPEFDDRFKGQVAS